LIAKYVRWIEDIAAWKLDVIVAATPSIASCFPVQKTLIIQNFPRFEVLESRKEIQYNQRPNWVVYIGSLQEIRGAREMMRAMEILQKGFPEVKLKIAGKFNPASLEMEIKKFSGWKYVDFLGWQTAEQVRDLLGLCKIGLVLFYPLPNHVEAQPNKLFEYMASGLPVVVSDFPLWREIVQDHRCGLLVNPSDIQAIASAVKYLLDNPEEAEEMGKRGRELVVKRYRWKKEEEKLLSLYSNLITN